MVFVFGFINAYFRDMLPIYVVFFLSGTFEQWDPKPFVCSLENSMSSFFKSLYDILATRFLLVPLHWPLLA